MILLKINLWVAVLMLIFLSLTTIRGKAFVNVDDYKKSSESIIITLLRTILISLIPIINLGLLILYGYAFILADKEWYEKNIIQKIEKDQIKE